jgi:hypothetical protein
MSTYVKRFTIKSILMITVPCALLCAHFVTPFAPEKHITISCAIENVELGHRFRVRDTSWFRCSILTDYSGNPMLITEQKNDSVPMTLNSTSSTTWESIPANGYVFHSTQILESTSTFRVGIYVKEPTGFRERLVWSDWFTIMDAPPLNPTEKAER